MPRDGSNIYTQPFPDVSPGTTVASTVYNGFTHDVAQDLNTPRPIIAGGTGANNVDTALFNLNAEKAAQVVTNYDAQLWIPGSFYSATTASGGPIDGHAFSGVAYIGEALTNPPTNLNVTLEARDTSDGMLYIRRKIAGVWSGWALDTVLNGTAGIISGLQTNKVSVDGSIAMTGVLELPATAPTLGTHATNKTYVDAADAALLAAGSVLTTDVSNRVRYDAAQGLTENQQSQARANIDVTQKNYIINGGMMVSQENGTTSGTTDAYYAVDQFLTAKAGTTGTFTIAQVASVTPGGSPNRLRVTVTLADAAIAASDEFSILQRIEGLRTVDLRQGTASARTVTVSFGVKAPAGTYCVAIRNSAANRSYVGQYVIASGEANTDVRKSVIIPLDQSGTWLDTNGIGMIVGWTLMGGSTFQTTAGAWQAGNFFSTSSQFNVMATGGNVFELFDVSLTKGNVAPPYVLLDYVSELATCQRYWSAVTMGMRTGGSAGSAWTQTIIIEPVRTLPVTALITAGSLTNVAGVTFGGGGSGTKTNLTLTVSQTAAGDTIVSGRIYSINARL